MIPVRVPVDAPTYLVDGEHRLTPEHPLYAGLCPVCDTVLGDALIKLVYVGMAPEHRKETGWTTGAAVAVHTDCTSPRATRETDRET